MLAILPSVELLAGGKPHTVSASNLGLREGGDGWLKHSGVSAPGVMPRSFPVT